MHLVHDGGICWAQLTSGQQVPVPARHAPYVAAPQAWLTGVAGPLPSGTTAAATVEAWFGAHPAAAPDPLEPAAIETPIWGAAHDALRLANQIDARPAGLVIALLLAQVAQPARVRVLYHPAFIAACHLGQAAGILAGERCLAAATLAALAPHLKGGWCPVAVAVGDESPDCRFLFVPGGLALTGADPRRVTRAGFRQICTVLKRMESGPGAPKDA